MLRDLKDYVNLIFSLNNPIIYSVFLIFFFLLIVYIFYKYIFFPAQKKHSEEKKEYELKNARLMALFAELDPAPVIRIDMNAKIIHANDAAMDLNNNESIIGKDAADFFPQLSQNPSDLITGNKSFQFFFQTNGRYYEVWFKGIANLEIAQLYFNDITDRNLFEKELLNSKKKLQELSNHLQDKVEEERQRIARELHDSVGQNLLFIKLMLQNPNYKQPQSEREDNIKIISALEKSITELKRILFDLKPRILEEAGLNAAISSLCTNVSVESGIKGDVDFVGKEERLNNKLEVCIYRVIQEGLSNIVKHSKAKTFNVLLVNNSSSVRIMISDDGIGFLENNNNTISHFGLMNMKERVENFRGNFKIESSINKGSLLIAEIPKFLK
ncbi:MAG: histidine kinase [Ignavibacteriaceae bacterium]